MLKYILHFFKYNVIHTKEFKNDIKVDGHIYHSIYFLLIKIPI